MGGKAGLADPRFLVEHDGDPELSLVTRSSDGQMLFLANIATYIWVLSNRKPVRRQGYVQLIDAGEWYRPLRKNLGDKNCELAAADVERIVETFLAFEETPQSRIFPNAAFGYRKLTVERPLRLPGIDPGRVYKASEIKKMRANSAPAPDAPPVIRKIHRGNIAPDPLRGLFPVQIDGKEVVVEYAPDADLKDSEQVPLMEEGGIEGFLRREVLPYAPDAWYVPGSVKVGYEISFTRYFYQPQPLRAPDEIWADIRALERESEGLLEEIWGGANDQRSDRNL